VLPLVQMRHTQLIVGLPVMVFLCQGGEIAGGSCADAQNLSSAPLEPAYSRLRCVWWSPLNILAGSTYITIRNCLCLRFLLMRDTQPLAPDASTRVGNLPGPSCDTWSDNHLVPNTRTLVTPGMGCA